MGVNVNGVWHEELSDPSDSGGSNLSDESQSPSSPNYQGGGGNNNGGGGYDSGPVNPGTPSNNNQGGGGGQAVYNTGNGPKTLQQMFDELKSAGWPGPAGGLIGNGAGQIANAYQSTTGHPVVPGNQSAANQTGPAQTQALYTSIGQQNPFANGGNQNNNNDNGIGDALQKLLQAIAAGNQAAAAEAAREFDQQFGLDTKKFEEAVKEYTQNFGLAEAGLTGQYQGNPTLAAQLQQAQLSGQYNGSPTEQAREFDVTAANQGLQTRNQILQTIASAQNDPFRQLEVQYGANGFINGMTGQTNAVPQFGAVQGSAQGTGTLGAGQQLLGQAGGSTVTNQAAGAANPNTPNFSAGLWGGNPAVQSSILAKFRSPTDVVARNYITSDQGTQNMITSAISKNTGLNQQSIDKQIRSQLPSSNTPAFGAAQI